jgi:Acetyltransferases
MIKIIKGNPSYLPGVLNLCQKIRNEFKKEHLNIYQDISYPNKSIFLTDLSNSDCTFLVVDNDKVIGFLTSEKESDFFNNIFDGDEKRINDFLEKYKLTDYRNRFIGFSRLMVDPDYRYQGFGSKLMTLMDKKYNGSVIIFLAHKDNKAAQKLYQKLNYICVGLEKFVFGEYYIYIKNQL